MKKIVWVILLAVLSMLLLSCGKTELSEDGDRRTDSSGMDSGGTDNGGTDSGGTDSSETDSGKTDNSGTDSEIDNSRNDSGMNVPEDSGQDVNPVIRDMIASMTLEEKVGQMFLARCPTEQAAVLAEQYQLGGYILFAPNFEGETKESVRAEIESCQQVSKISMLMAVDEEGGTVNRISRFSQFRAVPFWSSQDLYAEGGWNLIESDTEEKAELLRSLGLQVNMAPVCDVCEDKTGFMYDRSFGQDAELTSEYVEHVVRVMAEEQVGSVLKHFPGYGDNADTHTGIAVDERSLEEFREKDFLPFAAGIAAGADSVLVSHNIVTSMDADRPASLSAEVHRILREELGFDGVIMTDDLVMDAVKEYAGDEEAAVLAVLAGNDMLCCTDFEIQLPAVIAAVRDGRISEERIEESVERVLTWKQELGLLPEE